MISPLRLTPALVALCACVYDRAAEPSPSLVLVDSTVLEESDSAFIGEASGIAALTGGGLLVADRANLTIHQFARNGSRARSLGRRGPGPGEFSSGLGELLVAGDSLLLVQVGATVKALSLFSGEERWSRRIPGSAFPPSVPLASAGDRFYFRLIDADGHTSVATVTGATDEPVRGGPYPGWLMRSQLIRDAMSHLQVVPLGRDTIAVAIEVSDHLFIGPFGGPFDTIPVQRLHRRGARPDLLATIRDDDPAGAAASVHALSIPRALRRLSSGHLVHVVDDVEALTGRFASRLLLSVVDPGERTTCPDAAVPAPPDPRPLVAFDGDTLLVLTQLLPDSGRPSTVVRRYVIATDACRWVVAD